MSTMKNETTKAQKNGVLFSDLVSCQVTKSEFRSINQGA